MLKLGLANSQEGVKRGFSGLHTYPYPIFQCVPSGVVHVTSRIVTHVLLSVHK